MPDSNRRRRVKYLRLIWPIVATAIVVYVALHAPPRELLRSVATLGEIVIEVGLACFIGGILEYRSWLRTVTVLAAPLMRFARLPRVCADAFVSAMVSGSVAAMMLADHRRDRRLSRREMILSALCNATPSLITFSLVFMLPVVGAIGLAGVFYYGITYGIAILMLLAFLTLARFTAASGPGADAVPDLTPRPPDPWRRVIVKSAHRTGALLLRVMAVTAPLYLLTAHAARSGFFNLGRNAVPPGLEPWLNTETMTILAARMGGMLSASGITAELLGQHKVTVAQAVFVLLLGNIINNPIRTLRRSLPVALGIYPGGDGAVIVITLLVCRLCLNAAAITVLIICCSS